jgi:monoamine oxidase
MADVVIVGSGAAGISAARQLAASGLSCTILEARDRIGGRAFTDTVSLPGHWDQGCQWFHCADINPLVREAEALGWDFERRDRTELSMTFLDGRWQGAEDLQDYGRQIDAAFDAVYTAGERGLDVPVSQVLLESGPWKPLVHNLFQLMISADPEVTSTLGYADYVDTTTNWIVTGGLGALIARLAQGLTIRTGVAVHAVDLQPGGVRVETSQGALDAKAVIVTAPTNVLLSGAIRFPQGAAQPVLDRMQDLPCGSYEKVALAFDRLPFDPSDPLFCSIVARPDAPPLGFQIVAGPHPKLIAHIAGSAARDLIAQGQDAMIGFARDSIHAAFGASAARAITGSAVTGWEHDPWSRGAYSYARVGAGTARKAMIAANAGPIRFAGEAFSLAGHSTAHGAWQSGRDVAIDLADAIRQG